MWFPKLNQSLLAGGKSDVQDALGTYLRAQERTIVSPDYISMRYTHILYSVQYYKFMASPPTPRPILIEPHAAATKNASVDNISYIIRMQNERKS